MESFSDLNLAQILFHLGFKPGPITNGDIRSQYRYLMSSKPKALHPDLPVPSDESSNELISGLFTELLKKLPISSGFPVEEYGIGKLIDIICVYNGHMTVVCTATKKIPSHEVREPGLFPKVTDVFGLDAFYRKYRF